MCRTLHYYVAEFEEQAVTVIEVRALWWRRAVKSLVSKFALEMGDSAKSAHGEGAQ